MRGLVVHLTQYLHTFGSFIIIRKKQESYINNPIIDISPVCTKKQQNKTKTKN